jgi:hypothetical protein
MTKQEQFLLMVQTAAITNGINLISQPDMLEKYRHVYSATGVLAFMDEAIRASELIPADKTANDAAFDFCGYMLKNLRDAEEKAHSGGAVNWPDWFAR